MHWDYWVWKTGHGRELYIPKSLNQEASVKLQVRTSSRFRAQEKINEGVKAREGIEQREGLRGQDWDGAE